MLDIEIPSALGNQVQREEPTQEEIFSMQVGDEERTPALRELSSPSLVSRNLCRMRITSRSFASLVASLLTRHWK